MSFYGEIKRVNSSPFVFDKIYPNRVAMEAGAQTDNVYVGRYVLINYTMNPNDPNTFLDKYATTSGDENASEPITFSEQYQENFNIDIRAKYGAGFHGTVWQKIFTGANNTNTQQYKYIMIAELNSRAPFIKLVNEGAPMYEDKNGEEHLYNVDISPILSGSSEDSYVYTVPNTLELSLENSNLGNLIGNPEHYVTPTGLDSETALNRNEAYLLDNNKIGWLPIYGDEHGNPDSDDYKHDITGKKLIFSLPALTQLFNDLYDMLYGTSDNEETTRPFFANNLDDKLGENTNGLLGILASLTGNYLYIKAQDNGLEYDENTEYYIRDNEGNYTLVNPSSSADFANYYVKIYNGFIISQWMDADEAQAQGLTAFTNGIPQVIGSVEEYNANYALNGMQPDYYIDYESWTLAPLN